MLIHSPAWRRREISNQDEESSSGTVAHEPQHAAEHRRQWLSGVSPRKMKRRPERPRLEMAFLLRVSISTDYFPSHPLPTSPPGSCHSHLSSPLYFPPRWRETVRPAIQLKDTICVRQKNESDWKCEIEILNELNGNVSRSFEAKPRCCCTATIVEKCRRSNFF